MTKQSINKIRNFRTVFRNYEMIRENLENIQGSTILTSQQKEALIRIRQRSLSALAERMADDLIEIENFLETLDDHELRAIIRAHYLIGDTWTKCTERIMQQDHSEAAKQRVYRFFKAMEADRS